MFLEGSGIKLQQEKLMPVVRMDFLLWWSLDLGKGFCGAIVKSLPPLRFTRAGSDIEWSKGGLGGGGNGQFGFHPFFLEAERSERLLKSHCLLVPHPAPTLFNPIKSGMSSLWPTHLLPSQGPPPLFADVPIFTILPSSVWEPWVVQWKGHGSKCRHPNSHPHILHAWGLALGQGLVRACDPEQCLALILRWETKINEPIKI